MMVVLDKFNPEMMRKVRIYLNFSQEKMAENLGVNRVSYSRWESGAQEPQSPQMLQLALEALVNRRLLIGCSEDYREQFQTQSKAIDGILSEIDRLQKMRVRRKNSDR